MEPYHVSTSCEAVSSHDEIHSLKEIVFPYKSELAAQAQTGVEPTSMLLRLHIPASVIEEVEDRRDAAEADRILRGAGPADFVPWEMAKERLGL